MMKAMISQPMAGKTDGEIEETRERAKAKLEEIKAEADKEAVGIDPKLMQRYKDIRKHCFPPMALLDGDRCGGCNMSLPSVVMRDIRSGEKLVECDNCGRIIYAQE